MGDLTFLAVCVDIDNTGHRLFESLSDDDLPTINGKPLTHLRRLWIDPSLGGAARANLGDIAQLGYHPSPTASLWTVDAIVGHRDGVIGTYEHVTDGRPYARYMCCNRAQIGGPCVCHVVIECPVHGTQHIGTHD